jgi:hypothetical protein
MQYFSTCSLRLGFTMFLLKLQGGGPSPLVCLLLTIPSIMISHISAASQTQFVSKRDGKHWRANSSGVKGSTWSMERCINDCTIAVLSLKVLDMKRNSFPLCCTVLLEFYDWTFWIWNAVPFHCAAQSVTSLAGTAKLIEYRIMISILKSFFISIHVIPPNTTRLKFF